MDAAPDADAAADPKTVRTVIGASSLGTVFEWYDFFIYGTLAASGIIGRTFFPAGDETLQTLLAWAGFAVGFVFRPLGAILFGYMGDRMGRKYTFLVTITLMGVATAGVGLVPSAASIGLAAPALIILLRILQGLALGGEYGGAAVYVAEHAPPGKAGFYTSFVQASVSAGFVLSLAVVLGTRMSMSEAGWSDWGWRIPFLLSLLLLAISLWMRIRLSESPVFKAMKAEGGTAANPFRESFTYPGNFRRILVALFGVAAGLTVVWYTAMFGTLSFLQGAMRMDQVTAQLVVGAGALAGLFWFVFFGRLSDRVGRRKPILLGYLLFLILLFPLFWAMGGAADPARAATRGAGDYALILLVLVTLSALSGATFGPVAALLAEMFPPRIRYSSMSIPYHFGTGYFGGFLPLVSAYIVDRTGDPYAGLWYSWAVVAMALAVSFLWLPETVRLNGAAPKG
jgi:MFS family permease